MTDKLSKEQRSANMRAVRGRNTAPEMRVRQLAHALGHRFRLHRSELAGRPDLAFPSQRKAIFVHGCFWHGHRGCKRSRAPSSNVAFWQTKLAKNAERDARQLAALKASGWRALVVWECELKNEARLKARLRRFLG